MTKKQKTILGFAAGVAAGVSYGLNPLFGKPLSYPDYAFECTLLRSRKVWPGGHHNLDIIAAYCSYDMTNHHHALADAEACAIIAKQIL